MNSITLTPRSDLSRVATEDLRRELAQAIGITAKTLGYLAHIWRELESRGEDLSDLRTGLMAYLPLIADGRLEPELVVRCAGQAMLLKAASEIPLPEQRRLLDEGAVVAEIDHDGEIVEVRRPLEHLSSADTRRLFSGTTLRTPQEQARLLRRIRPMRTASRGVIIKVRVTQAEYRQLRDRAAASGKQVPTYLRDCVLDIKK